MRWVPELECSEVQRALQAAVEKAQILGILVSVAVVDGGGNLKAFFRMNGAKIAGCVLAVDKAYTAVANRCETEALGAMAQPGESLYGIHANHGGRFVIFGGGVPVFHEGLTIAGIGVSGGRAEEDTQCARAGLEALAIE